MLETAAGAITRVLFVADRRPLSKQSDRRRAGAAARFHREDAEDAARRPGAARKRQKEMER